MNLAHLKDAVMHSGAPCMQRDLVNGLITTAIHKYGPLADCNAVHNKQQIHNAIKKMPKHTKSGEIEISDKSAASMQAQSQINHLSEQVDGIHKELRELRQAKADSFSAQQIQGLHRKVNELHNQVQEASATTKIQDLHNKVNELHNQVQEVSAANGSQSAFGTVQEITELLSDLKCIKDSVHGAPDTKKHSTASRRAKSVLRSH